jgi:hypothetical protein
MWGRQTKQWTLLKYTKVISGIKNRGDDKIRKSMWGKQIKQWSPLEYMKVIRRKNNCGTWEMTSGNSGMEQKNSNLKWFIIKLYKNDQKYI